MKPLLLSLALFTPHSAPVVHTNDVALMEVRIGKEKLPHSVAIEFYTADAPATVANFEKLAREKFYNGQTFHRVFPHTLVQAGDPNSRSKDKTHIGIGGPGYTLAPEIHRKHALGAVAAARLPDKINPSRMSNGSQFFVCLRPMPEYDGQYTVFGHVLYGLDTLDTISAMSVDTNDNPIERITIKSLRIVPREQLPAAPSAQKPAAAKPAKKPWWKLF